MANEMMALFELIFSSTSDSSDDELNEFLLSRERRKTPKIKNYIVDVVYKYSDEEFRSHFRVTRTTSNKLISLFEASDFYPSTSRGGPKKSAEAHILAFLWYVGNKTTLRSVADRFNMAKSTLHACNDRVLQFLLSISPQVIRFPRTEGEKDLIADDFAAIAGIPGIIGCVDGTFIDIRCPAHKLPSTYVNRHHQTSFTLQAICDAHKRFIDCFTGLPGKCHASRVFKLSFIYPLIHQLGDGYHIIGDSAYPISKNLLTPYKNYGNLTAIQQRYNQKFNKTRVKIENCFSLSRGRFRQLILVEFTTVEKISKLILACCVLHNLCIDNNDLFNEELLQQENIFNYVDQYVPGREVMQQEGERKRNLIAQNL